MRSSSARCFASKGDGGSGALGALVVLLDDLWPNSAENGNRLGVCGVSAAGLAGGAVPVFGWGAGVGSGTFPVATGSARAEAAIKLAAIKTPPQMPIAARRTLGASAIRPEIVRPDFAGRVGAIIPLPAAAL